MSQPSAMRTLLAVVLACAALLPADIYGAELSDAEIRENLIRRSIASYRGNCPCPYNVNRAARRCGASSAYSKPGGEAPLCYPEDVTQEMIAAFRAKT
jgi:hypothetical protein